MAASISYGVTCPIASMITAPDTIPVKSTRKTLNPAIPPTSTSTYGMICVRLYSCVTAVPISARKELIRIRTSDTIAAGSAIQKFSRNLSFISHPCPLQAAIVVSDMKERLSPNMEPPITDATQSAWEKPDVCETAAAIGVRRVIVPTEVPIAVETKHATTNRTATANRAGMIDSIKYATLSALLLPTTPTKVPAVRKISSIVIIFLSPIPRPMISSFSSKLTFLFCRHATRSAARNATTIGTL